MKQSPYLGRIWVSILLVLLIASSSSGQRSDFKGANFNKADSTANAFNGRPLTRLYALTLELTAPFTTDVEKVRAIYTWICRNIRNDIALSAENEKMRIKYANDPAALAKWNEQLRPRAFERLLRDKSTVCTGYALLMRNMAAMVNIECKVIDGFGRTPKSNVHKLGLPNHSWNAIRLNGRWYLCDPTWSSGAVDMTSREFHSNYVDGYFLADPEQFIQDHYPLDTTWTLLTSKPTIKEFLSRPLTYRASYRHGVQTLRPESFQQTLTKGNSITFSFTAEPGIDHEDVKVMLKVGHTVTSFSPEMSEEPPGSYRLTQKFDFVAQYDVHLMVKDEAIATYIVAVKRK